VSLARDCGPDERLLLAQAVWNLQWSRFDSQNWTENRAPTQIYRLLINQTLPDLRSNADFKTTHAFSHCLGRLLPVITDSNGKLAAGHGHEACWATPMQSGGQVECNFAFKRPEHQS